MAEKIRFIDIAILVALVICVVLLAVMPSDEREEAKIDILQESGVWCRNGMWIYEDVEKELSTCIGCHDKRSMHVDTWTDTHSIIAESEDGSVVRLVEKRAPRITFYLDGAAPAYQIEED